MFYAEKNNGAYLNNKRIRVSKKNNFNDCLFATSGSIEKEVEFSYRKSGSAALDMAYVGCGRYRWIFSEKFTIMGHSCWINYCGGSWGDCKQN